jgi:alpha-L-fucosidase
VKGDLVADFIAACQAEGIVPGVSYVISDVRLEGATRGKSEPVLPVHFAAILRQITELHTRYPGLGVQIFGASPRLSPVQWNQLVGTVHKLNSQCVILDETHEPLYFPRSVLDKGWFWSSGVGIGPTSQLIQSWQECQAEKKAFILSVAPDTSGRIPKNQLAVLAEMKTHISHQ